MSNPSNLRFPGGRFPFRSDAALLVGDITLKDIWVVEWSQSQQAFHVETLIDALQGNLLGFMHQGKTGDYIILGLFPTREKCDEYNELLYARMKQWGLSRFTPDDLLRDLSP